MQPRSKPPLDERSILGVLLLSLCGACATPTKEEAPPPFTVSVETFCGTVLTGPVPGEPQLDVTPWSVDLSVAQVDRLPEDLGEPLAPWVRHVLAERGGEPLRTRGELARGVRVAAGEISRPLPVWEQRQVGALWPGTTVRWSTTPNPDSADPARTSWEVFGVEVSRRAGEPQRLEFALSFDGWVTPRVEEDTEEPPASQPVYQRERVVLDSTSLAAGESLCLLLPGPRFGLPRAATIVEVRITTAPDLASPGLQAAVERSRAALAQTEDDALAPEGEFRFERARALEALDDDPLRRPALVFIANATDAEPTSELALMADEESLASFLQDLQEQLAESDAPLDDPQEFGWFLEVTTYRWLAQLAADPERVLLPELASLLVRHAGELGRYPELVQETVAASTDQNDIRQRFDAENRIFLEDSHPAARVRAFDWLSQRGAAPAGYDPLGSLAERRDALAQSAEETP